MAAILNVFGIDMHAESSKPREQLSRFDSDTRQRLRSQLVRRREQLAGAVAACTIGTCDESTLRTLGVKQAPGTRVEDALRAALEQADRRRFLLDANDDGYGRCDVCGVDLGQQVLGEMPWLDRCKEHDREQVIDR